MGKRHSIRLVKHDLWQARLNPQDVQYVEVMLDAWKTHRQSAGNRDDSIRRDVGAIMDLLMHCGQPPWLWTEGIFESWSVYLARNRRLRRSTQRQYQSSIRRFIEYLMRGTYFISETQRRYGTSLRQIVYPENSLVHRLEDEAERARPILSSKEVSMLFQAIDQEIAIRVAQNHKGRLTLMRDKAFFATMYVTAARIGELTRLDINSFLDNPDFPEFGEFGRVSVLGKGSKGSGFKRRIITIDHPALPGTLRWYKRHIYPEFLRRGDPNEVAFFLNERGRRVSRGSMEQQFSGILEMAGLDGRGFSPHSLRGTSITHGAMMHGGSLAMKFKAGHVYQATTEGYADYPDSFVRDQVREATRRLVKSRHEADEDKEPND